MQLVKVLAENLVVGRRHLPLTLRRGPSVLPGRERMGMHADRPTTMPINK